MFYNQLVKLCEKEGIKPTPLIKSLGFSAGNLKRWEDGATVNSDILIAISEHFKVSIDYLLTGKENKKTELTENEIELLKLFEQFTEREQLKVIGKVEDILDKYRESEKLKENVG